MTDVLTKHELARMIDIMWGLATWSMPMMNIHFKLGHLILLTFWIPLSRLGYLSRFIVQLTETTVQHHPQHDAIPWYVFLSLPGKEVQFFNSHFKAGFFKLSCFYEFCFKLKKETQLHNRIPINTACYINSSTTSWPERGIFFLVHGSEKSWYTSCLRA